MTSQEKKSLISVIGSPPMLVSLFMGFSCGLPLLLTISLLQAWMRQEGVDLGLIGLMTLVGLPYTVKFLWAPVMDRYTLPFLGLRRGWLLVAQIFLMVSIAYLGTRQPAANPTMVAFAAILVTFFSASQDIVVDAYRREDLTDEELGFGSAAYYQGYRVGMLLASGGGMIMADHMSFSSVYLIMALCLIPGVLTTLIAREPKVKETKPETMREAVFDPLIEYFSRDQSVLILLFILCYKIGDSMAGAMTTPFYLEIGYTLTQIGSVVKLFGFTATVGGALLGGVLMAKLGINRSLWVFGVLQALSTACFALLIKTGPSVLALGGVIAFENLSAGMGTAAFMAYMASLANKHFTATQYALLTSLMAIPRVVASAPTGYYAKHLGWNSFFIFCALIAIPGMIMLFKVAPWNGKNFLSGENE